MSLSDTISGLFAEGAHADKAAARAAFFELQQQLSQGHIRAAEPDPSAATGWRVNAWVKQGILLGFRFGDTVDVSADHGRWPFYDKDTMPLKKPGVAAGVRIVPGGSTIREGAYVASSVVCMPPMYVNIGAYIDEGALVDSHALVGSCAQIGRRVHLSAGAQIGGVIEPVGALPVVIEDDVLVGGNTGVYEGAVVKQRAVLAAGVILTASTPIYDLPRGVIIRAPEGQPLVVPEGAVVVPGARAVSVGAGKEWGLSLATPVIVKYRDDRTDTRTELEDVDPLTQLQLTRELVDIDSTTPHEIAAGTFLADTLQRLGYEVVRQPVVDGRFNIFATAGRPDVVLTTHFDCVPPFFPSREAGGRLYGRGSCDAKGILVAQIAAAERLRAAGESRVGLLFVVGEERGSEGAKAANTIAPGSRFIVNGEPTDNRLATATRGVYRARLRAIGKAAHSSLPHLGVSAIDKLVDALLALRGIAWPADPDMGTTFYTIGLINGGIAPNVISPDAEAEIMFRTVGGYETLRRLIETTAGTLVAIDDVLVVPPVRLTTRPGFDTDAFSFTTDIPFLDRWGAPLLLGPGSVTVAHTADENVEIAELHRAVELYERLARELMT